MQAHEQGYTLAMTPDQKLWERFFGVADDKDPYVVPVNANGALDQLYSMRNNAQPCAGSTTWSAFEAGMRFWFHTSNKACGALER
jgi:hypothetical protein